MRSVNIPGADFIPLLDSVIDPWPAVILGKFPIMAKISSICLFCGSRGAVDPAFRDTAGAFGRLLGERRITLVYGGGQVGLMGLAADACLAAGGQVVGIIPQHLHMREVEHKGLTKLHVVSDMHTRKRMMFELADAFVVLPGGIGTLDELCEVLSWQTLGYHQKPILLLDLKDFWRPFMAALDHVVAQGFAGDELTGAYRVIRGLDEMLPALAAMPEPKASYPERF